MDKKSDVLLKPVILIKSWNYKANYETLRGVCTFSLCMHL